MQRSCLVVYDGGCGMCSRSVALVSGLDWLRRVSFVDVNADWSRLSRTYPTLSRDACIAEMHVITGSGRILSGFDGSRALAALLPLGWLSLPFLYIPGVAPIGRRLYRAIAGRRRTTTCALPPARHQVDLRRSLLAVGVALGFPRAAAKAGHNTLTARKK